MKRLILVATAAAAFAVAGTALADHHDEAEAQGVQVAEHHEGAANPCNTNPCNPCAAENPCNPCAGTTPDVGANNPCNPCAGANPCSPEAGANPCAPANPCGGSN